MSLTFSITYQNNVKKVSCQRTSSVGQLAAAALEKFKLPSSTAAVLSHGGKRLDGTAPIRFTNLINNSKLTLEVASANSEITLKVIGVVEGQSASHVMKVKSDLELPSLVSGFLQLNGTQLPLDSKFVKLTMMQSSADSAMPDFSSMTVGNLVGSVSSAAVRLYIEDKADMLKREAVLQEHTQARKNYEEAQRQRKAEEASPQAQLSVFTPDKAKPQESKPDDETQISAGPKKDSREVQQEHEVPQSSVTPKKEDSEPVPTPVASRPEPVSAGQNTTTDIPDVEMKEPTEDTLYVPSTSTRIYENPDQDYEMTTSQAEKYYNMLKTMQKRPQAKTPRKPSKYVIRVRFPDRALLDLQLEASANLGQFLKKLDSYLHPEHINSYVLKNGLPPFKEIKVGFSANSMPLTEHPDFQQEKILLIWESTNKQAPATYLKPGIHTRDVNELPTVVLESNREHLEEETTKKSVSKPESKRSGESKSKGFPKWFKR